MNHSPLQKWADAEPYRWYAVATVICFLVLSAYGYGAVSDELDYMQAMQDERIAAAQQAQQELNKRIALQEACGGPEATVVDLVQGGHACLDKDGRRTKTIPGLARPVSQGPQDAARVFGARLQQMNSECANSDSETKSAGLVPAGFLKTIPGRKS